MVSPLDETEDASQMRREPWRIGILVFAAIAAAVGVLIHVL